MINKINLEGLNSYRDVITKEEKEALSSYGITAEWQGGVNSKITTHNQKVGSSEIKKDFSFEIGEPNELLGDNSRPTPQDYLLGGLAGCMMVGFVVGASNNNIKLDDVKLHITGTLDLRGFLNVNPESPVGFDTIEFSFEVKGNGTQEQYDKIINDVRQFSPNYRTITDNVKMKLVTH
ncbi:OsmC family protein [Tenacibaculum sp. nBUS_03]|uniref:OsmC family protein n=1 Tax=Tenacibaculum sp. nBUS_03 TaxID=3395320 RepID=UPI003EBDAD1F